MVESQLESKTSTIQSKSSTTPNQVVTEEMPFKHNFEMPELNPVELPKWYLSAADAIKMDHELFGPNSTTGYEEGQLMELAGLSVSQAFHDFNHK